MLLGIGTAALGRPQYINIRGVQSKANSLTQFKTESLSVLEYAYQQGIRYFDTAPGYGMAEDLLLEWLKDKQDDTIEIATKWGYTYTANFNPNAKVHEVKEHSLGKLKEQWQVSKQFLPRLKVYQIHSATNESGVLQNVEVLNYLYQLKIENHIKIGLTTTGNNQAEILKKALDISVNGQSLFDAFQVTYNVLDQSLLDMFSKSKFQDKAIIVKEALANGRLFRNKNYPNYNELYNVTEAIAKKYQVGVDAVLLRFCVQTIPKGIVLSGASNRYEISENLKMTKIKLSSEEIDRLKQFRIDPKPYWDERKQLVWN